MPVDVTTRFVKMLCARGDAVRYEIVPGLTHVPAGKLTAARAVPWIADRFAGKPAPNNCSSHGFPAPR